LLASEIYDNFSTHGKRSLLMGLITLMTSLRLLYHNTNRE